MKVSTKTRDALKRYFIKNAIPTEANFSDLLDGVIVQNSDGIVRHRDGPIAIESASEPSDHQTLSFYRSLAEDDYPAWTISLVPATSDDPATTPHHFNLSDGDGESRIFVDQETGRVGLGTDAPEHQLHIVAGNPTGDGTRALFVTGNIGESSGVEIRRSGGDEGIGFGFNTIYATGPKDDQPLKLQAYGNGAVEINSDLRIKHPYTLSFDDGGRQMIDLWRKSYGIGIQTNTLYFRTGGNVVWYRGGSHEGEELDAGGGSHQMGLDHDGHLSVKGGITSYGDLIARGSLEAADDLISRKDFTVDGMASFNGDAKIAGDFYVNKIVGDLEIDGDLRTTGAIRSPALDTRVYSVMHTNSVDLERAASRWENIPEMTLSFDLPRGATVWASYQLSAITSGYVGICETRLASDGSGQPSSYAVAETGRWTNSGAWLYRMSEQSSRLSTTMKLAVQVRTPDPSFVLPDIPESKWTRRTLSAVVFGV